jgi:hypothetical protein
MGMRSVLTCLLLLTTSGCCHAREGSVGDLLIPFSTGNTAVNIDPRSAAAMPAGCKGNLCIRAISVAAICRVCPVMLLSVTASYCGAPAAAAPISL